MTPEQSAQPDAWVEKAVDMFFKMGNLSMDLGGHEGDAASYEALSKEAKALAGEFLSHLLARPPAVQDVDPVETESVQGMSDADYIKTLQYEVDRMGHLHQHAETRHANLLMDLHRLLRDEQPLNHFDEVYQLAPLVLAGRYGTAAYCPACFEQVTPEQRAAVAPSPSLEVLREARDALVYLHREKIDYMIRNKLGNPAKETGTKLAVAAIAKLEAAIEGKAK